MERFLSGVGTLKSCSPKSVPHGMKSQTKGEDGNFKRHHYISHPKVLQG
jgi:hypothetical protein